MRRFIVAVSVVGLILGMTLVSSAGDSAQEMVMSEKAWFGQILGVAASNPIHAPATTCGEIVDEQLFLLPPIGPGLRTKTCTITSATEIIASPAGSFSEKPLDGKTDTKLFAASLGYLQDVIPASIKVMVDDALVPKPLATCTDPFVIPIEEGSFLPEVDDMVTGTSDKVSGCGWFYVVGPLTAGEHTVFLSGKFKGDKKPGQLQFDITVSG